MTKLEELINELCPDGVEYFTLEELGTFYGGLTGKSKKDFEKGNAKFITYMNVYSNPALKLDVSDVVTIGENEKQNCIQYADILFTGSSETPNDCGMSSVLTEYTDENLYLNSFSFGYRFNNPDKFDVIYLKHLFRSHMLRKQIVKTANGVTRFNVSKAKMAKVQIPVPPKEVQNEIGKTLDNFTELTAELTARQKQYAFYRDYLLDFSNEDVTKKIPDIDCSNVEYKRLGDIATAIYRGAGIKRDEVTETGIPCVRYGEIYTTYNVTFNNCVSHTDEDKIQNKKYFEHGDVLFAITGESVEEIAKSCVYLGHDKCLAGGDIVVLKHNQNPKYMAYVLSTTNAQSQKSKGKVKSKVVHSSVPAISDIIIPIPPLAEQEKIANMIERFDHLCNDISNGLPAEIEARKKQYEYYRDTLLSFDDKACSHIVKVERERERELTRTKAIKWLELQDILKIKNGKDYKSFNTGNYPVYGSGGIMAYVDTFAYDKPSVLIPRKGSIDKLYYVDVPFWNVDTIFYTDINNEIVLTKYVYYWLQKEHLEKLNTAGGVPSLTQTVLNKVKIAVPPLEEQERIVSILDRFDKICNDISDGLPAEIEARQKQYEYYRDKLLSFKEKNHA